MSTQVDWRALEARYATIGDALASPSLDHQERHKLQKEYASLGDLIGKWRELTQVGRDIDALEATEAGESDADYRALVAEELDNLRTIHRTLQHELDELLYPPDPLDDRSVFLEIRAGTGGQEAALFAGDLARMYLMYAQRKGWRAAITSESSTELGGYREVVLQIEGKGVYGHLKRESGVHRVQRVPATETSGRIHTSTVTVAVLPEAEDVELTISPQDVRIDLYRASGAGGQHVNVTDSAVRLTHIPTGLVVACQDERSQHKNKAKAFKILQSRLLAMTREKQESERQQQRRDMVGSGDRSEKVRTYNYPQNRVTDHQVDLTVKNLDMVMEGDLEDIMQALREKDLQERRAKQTAGLLS